jgi:hypothetical protein
MFGGSVSAMKPQRDAALCDCGPSTSLSVTEFARSDARSYFMQWSWAAFNATSTATSSLLAMTARWLLKRR